MRKTVAALFILLSLLAAPAAEAWAQHVRYDVKVGRENPLGEKIPVVISATNTGPGRVRVKDMGMLKISMRLRGRIHGEKVEEREYRYDGSRGVPVIHEPQQHGDALIFFAPTYVKKPDVVLGTGQSTSREFADLHRLFNIWEGVAPGVYTLTVRLDGGPELRRTFRVVVDGERTFERLLRMLKSESDAERNWASHYLFEIDERRALAAHRSMLESGGESVRGWARGVLHSRGYLKQ